MSPGSCESGFGCGRRVGLWEKRARGGVTTCPRGPLPSAGSPTSPPTFSRSGRCEAVGKRPVRRCTCSSFTASLRCWSRPRSSESTPIARGNSTWARTTWSTKPPSIRSGCYWSRGWFGRSFGEFWLRKKALPWWQNCRRTERGGGKPKTSDGCPSATESGTSHYSFCSWRSL